MWQPAPIGTAILFQVGQALIGLYLSRFISANIYGAAAGVIVLLVWVYYLGPGFPAGRGIHSKSGPIIMAASKTEGPTVRARIQARPPHWQSWIMRLRQEGRRGPQRPRGIIRRHGRAQLRCPRRGGAIAPGGGNQIPFERGDAVLRHALATLEQHGKIELGIDIALRRGAAEPGSGALVVFADAFALSVSDGQIVHRLEIAVQRRFLKPGESPRRIFFAEQCAQKILRHRFALLGRRAAPAHRRLESSLGQALPRR